MDLTLKEASMQRTKPKFVYTHLVMPHDPYYFNKNAEPLPFDSLREGKQMNKENYIGYLQYCNKRVINFTDSLLKNSAKPPIVILMSDHGFRYFQKKTERPWCFNNLMAVYLPSQHYSNFYNGLSAVNFFPVLFNSEFHQQLPIKKDSTIYLWD